MSAESIENQFEVDETIRQLRKCVQFGEVVGPVDPYWIEETICSLIGMRARILELETA